MSTKNFNSFARKQTDNICCRRAAWNESICCWFCGFVVRVALAVGNNEASAFALLKFDKAEDVCCCKDEPKFGGKPAFEKTAFGFIPDSWELLEGGKGMPIPLGCNWEVRRASCAAVEVATLDESWFCGWCCESWALMAACAEVPLVNDPWSPPATAEAGATGKPSALDSWLCPCCERNMLEKSGGNFCCKIFGLWAVFDEEVEFVESWSAGSLFAVCCIGSKVEACLDDVLKILNHF